MSSQLKINDKIGVSAIVFFYIFLNSFLNLLKSIVFMKLKKPKDFKNIIIFRNGNIGDIVCAMPAINAIHESFPTAKITLLSSPGKKGMPGAQELLVNVGFIKELIIYYKEDIQKMIEKFMLIKKLRSNKFDLFIELPQDLIKLRTLIRDIIFAKAIGVKYAFGFQISTIRICKQFQSKYLRFDNEQTRLAAILAKENINTSTFKFYLSAGEKDILKVNRLLNDFNLNKFVVINPNAKRQSKLWPLNSYADVGRRIIDKYDIEILIIGGQEDIERASQLQKMIGNHSFNMASELNLIQTAELIKRSMLVISNDTGMLHIADSLDKPIIGIYSGWHFKGKWYPQGANSIVFRKEPKCHTCYKENCEHITCLKMISADEVFEAADSILRRQLTAKTL